MTEEQTFWYQRDHSSFVRVFHYILNAAIPLPTFRTDAFGIVGGHTVHSDRLGVRVCAFGRAVLRLFDLGLVERPPGVKSGCWLVKLTQPLKADRPRLPEGGDL